MVLAMLAASLDQQGKSAAAIAVRSEIKQRMAAAERDYKAKTGKEHPLNKSSLNLMWVRMPNKPAFERLAVFVLDREKNLARRKQVALGPLLGGALVGEVHTPRDDAHAERPPDRRQQRAEVADAHDAECLAPEL